jgi:hypothetical protein
MPQITGYDPFYSRLLIETEFTFAWLPKKCHISGKRIWLKYGYRLTRIITGPGDSIFEYRWHDKVEHLIWKLKQ